MQLTVEACFVVPGDVMYS